MQSPKLIKLDSSKLLGFKQIGNLKKSPTTLAQVIAASVKIGFAKGGA